MHLKEKEKEAWMHGDDAAAAAAAATSSLSPLYL
jgi:hypothetical protein